MCLCKQHIRVITIHVISTIVSYSLEVIKESRNGSMVENGLNVLISSVHYVPQGMNREQLSQK